MTLVPKRLANPLEIWQSVGSFIVAVTLVPRRLCSPLDSWLVVGESIDGPATLTPFKMRVVLLNVKLIQTIY